MNSKRVLITGSSGFLGKNISQFLKDQGYQAKNFDLADGLDLLNENHLKKSLASVDYVCHLAAVGDVYLAAKSPKLAACVGVGGTANLIQVANNLKNIKKIIYASTWEVYGHPNYQPIDEKHSCNPDHPYSISKYAGELMFRSNLNHVPWVILRLGSAYGSNMRTNAVIPLFINKAKAGEVITIAGDGLQTRQFTHARDIARGFQLALESKIAGEVFNIVSKESQTIKEIAEMVKSKIPVRIKYTAKRQGDVVPAMVSSEKARRLLGWMEKVSFKDGFMELFGFPGN